MRLGVYTILCILMLNLFCFILPHPIPAQSIPEKALILKEDGDRAIMRGDMEEAVRLYEQALRIHPDFPDAVYFLGLTYDLDFEDPVNAVYYYRRYLELEPNGKESAEVLGLLRKAEKRLEERKRALGFVEEPSGKAAETKGGFVETPPQAQTSPTITSELPEAPIKAIQKDKTDNVITFQMQENILKYDIKLRVWEREGFIDGFNELARKRVSPLEEDIAGQRETLRMERKRVTDFINYQEEAVELLLKKAVFHGISALGIELNHYPEDLSPSPYIRSYEIIDIKENARFINFSAEIAIDLNPLARDLSARGYLFQPIRITLILQNVQGDLSERFIEQIIGLSNYAGPEAGGLYPVYTTMEIFVQEISNMKIGKYRFQPSSVGRNSVTLQVLLEAKDY
ncbi:MAG: tetratricopeptide repeat protein [bacterium]